MKSVLRILRGYQFDGQDAVFCGITRDYSRNQLALRLFYVCQFLVLFSVFRNALFFDYDKVSLLASWSNPIVKWVFEFAGLLGVQNALVLLGLLGNLCIFFILMDVRVRLSKIAYAFSLFGLMAINFAKGITQINQIIWLWLAVLFCFLPKAEANPSRAQKMSYNMVCFSSIVLVMSCYTLSGVWKFLGIVINPVFSDKVSLFEVNSFSYLVTNFLSTYRRPTLLAEYALNFPLLSALLLAGVLYLQFFAVFSAFRPRLLYFWAGGLALFHFLSLPLLNLSFDLQSVAVLFVVAAFSNYKSATFREMVLSLPLIQFFYFKTLGRYLNGKVHDV